MNIYETWVYEYVLNTPWFLWSVFWLIFGVNSVSWIILWFFLSGRSIWHSKTVKRFLRISNRDSS